MRKSIQLIAAATSVASLGLMSLPAQAASTIISIPKKGKLSSSAKIAMVKVKVTCSEDTTSARLTATLTQVTHGSVQTATGQLTAINAFECTGSEEKVWLPVRRPTGGFKWVKGAARVSNFVFETEDPSGFYADTAAGRSIMLK